MLSKKDIYLHLFLLCFLRKYVAVTVTVDDIDVAEGSEARITCNIVPASSGAVPVVTWYNVTNGANDLIAAYQGGFGTIEPGYIDRFSVENDITLVITNTLRIDSGTYQCSVNLVGDSPSVDDDICTLTVNYLDKPEMNFLTLVTEGDEVVMTCVVDSSPEAMCNFIKDGDVLPHDGSCTFTIPSASRADDGSYECEADNGVGNKQKSDNRNLEVQYKPDKDIANDQTVPPGETFTITSTVTANPSDVTYLWTTDLPGNEDSVNYRPTFTLKVSETEVDGTIYLVNITVTNIIGSTTDSANITISETTAESCNDTTGLTIGMFFVGIILGVLGFYIAEITHNKIKKKALSKEQDADKRKQDTYMDYGGDTGEQNQTYQDLQHKVEESAYVNVKAGNKQKGKV
ncbi:cell adhesion molecule CEACAM6-like [Antedon mediterranea]|uniref:cell adhesion molecule CEACAM6-like n=1 Tax=Antedon mediterranea TaxID=105859 RepID=UPI003AF95C67